jgi:glycerol-1-phosphate dehydrogenase [NAD(P)+]
VYVGEQAVERLLQFCARRRIRRATLVADAVTYRVLGARIAERWARRGWHAQVALLDGTPVVADERRIVQLLIQVAPADGPCVAVGAGTITDIVRFVSFVTRRKFISVPTAPSVDGFTSAGAALTIGRSKRTVPAQPPVAVFADLDTLAAAPKEMIAAGFGDMIGKFTSLADWRLGHLLWGEAYSAAIAGRVRRALERCLPTASPPTSRESVRGLMEALVESGQAMADFGSSEAASGSEHHLSHYWELVQLRQGRPPLLHGAKVGVSAVLVARIYDTLRRLTLRDVAERLKAAVLPEREAEVRAIRLGYDEAAESIIAAHAPFLDLTDAAFDALKRTIRGRWEAIQEIAASVPPAEEIAGTLRRLDAPVTPADLGLGKDDLARALRYASYLRNRFTVLKLARLLGLNLEEAALVPRGRDDAYRGRGQARAAAPVPTGRRRTRIT